MVNTEVAPDKIAAYHSTHYRIGSGTAIITLQIGEYAPKLQIVFQNSNHLCGVVITAYNPFGETRDHDTNLAAHKRLGEHLYALAPVVMEAEGADPTGMWPPEPSFFALGIDRNTARLLGTQYRQDAVVWVGANAVPELILLR